MGILQNLHLAFTATYKTNDDKKNPLYEVAFNEFKAREDFLKSVKDSIGVELPIINYEFGKQYAVRINKDQIDKIEDYVGKNKIVPRLSDFVSEMLPDETLRGKGMLYVVRVSNRDTMDVLVKKLEEKAGVEMKGQWGFNKLNEKIDNYNDMYGDITGRNNTEEGCQLRVNTAAYEHLMGLIKDMEKRK